MAAWHALSHEIAGWGDDPFVHNPVEPWLTPRAPQYGCTGIREIGDPVVGIGFSMGTNPCAQGPRPHGSQSADGTYHPEDEAFLPWFMGLPSSGTGSEPNQIAAGERYPLMGDLNPSPGSRAPAPAASGEASLSVTNGDPVARVPCLWWWRLCAIGYNGAHRQYQR